jgi:ligand-binding sensor domain-containing protein/signal transduction histidine kinase
VFDFVPQFIYGRAEMFKHKPMSFYLCRIVTVALFLSSLPAFSDVLTNPGWSVHIWQSNDGLPNNVITGLAQTDEGYLWIASASYVARFDGSRFVDVGLHEFMPGIRQKATTFLRSRSGNLWVGMSAGAVVCLNGGAPIIYTNGLPADNVQSLTEDRTGAIWVTYRTGAVCRIKNNEAMLFDASEGLPARDICWLANDTNENLWFGERTNIGVFEDGHFKTLVQTPRIVTGLAQASDGGVWVTFDNHLYHADAQGSLRDYGSFESRSQDATALLEDTRHTVWIGTTDKGLYCYDGSGFEAVPISYHEVSCLLEDREQNIWVGTDGGGLCRVSPRVVNLEGPESGLPTQAVQSICQGTDGRLWAVAQNGEVFCLSNGVWNVIMHAHTAKGWPSCVAAGADGAVWIVTQRGTLHRWQNGELTTLYNSEERAGIAAHALLVGRNGDVWLGGGRPDVIQRFRDGKLDTFAPPTDPRVIRALVEDLSGDIWAGTSKGLLLRISGDQMVDETAEMGGLLSIRCLYVTPDGALWIGYAGNGLGRLKDGHFERISTEQGLMSGDISQILADDEGWIWLGSDRGIFKIRQSDFESVADGTTKQVGCIYYGNDEGVSSLQANFSFSPGSLRSRDGRLWMPMLTALAVIDPGKISQNRIAADPLLEQVTMDDTTVAAFGGVLPVENMANLKTPDATLRLPPGHHRLEFDFTALSLSASENVRFRYRLAGFDDRWVETGSQRDAVYPQLAAGKYQFQVTACNSDGVWSPGNTSFAFSVAPYFWQTLWFRLLDVLLFAIMLTVTVYFIISRRLHRRLREVEQQAALDRDRTRIARDLHDEIGAKLSRISYLSEHVVRNGGDETDLKFQVASISKTSRDVLQALDEIVWVVNPENDTLENLASYIGHIAPEFLEMTGIECDIDISPTLPSNLVPFQIRHHLFLAVRESLTNILKHAKATRVCIRMTYQENKFQIVVSDDGVGFATSSIPESPRNGLRNMRQRLAEVGGDCVLESQPGQGTRLRFTVPLREPKGLNQ